MMEGMWVMLGLVGRFMRLDEGFGRMTVLIIRLVLYK